ncbi:MAG: hypothetical protein JL56_14290 [Desulfotomaculum sp. BICA1-6]|nr:MAG: hypothetical protein VR67_03015 [Peptococcaceae bacterium BRH_c8a]KJS71546.1 MAG: hypothetical protein JL56_14290 [Desulfotomaculum sp. BICA1-6]
MSIPPELNFATGVTVNILMINGDVFTGEIVDVEDNFLQLRLTAATGPFVAGEVVRLNLKQLIAIG